MRERRPEFEGLVRRHRSAIENYIARRVRPEDVEDLVSETFEVAWRKRSQLPAGRELPWLYGVAYRTIQHRWRSNGRWARLRAKANSQRPPVSEPASDPWLREQERLQVLEAAQRLAEADREVLRLTLWEELSLAETAVALGISVDAAKQRASRARRRLAAAYEEIEAESEEASRSSADAEVAR